MADQTTLVAALRRNWQDEMTSAATYRHLAEREPDERRRGILLKLAETEEEHAARWAERLRALGAPEPDPAAAQIRPSWLARLSDINVTLQRMEDEEDRHVQEYGRMAAALGDPASRKLAEELVQDEKEHAQVLNLMTGPPATPRNVLDVILRRERWHVRGAGWIGDAIYGVNDGLGAVFGVVTGVSGATGGSHVVLISGLAAMLASALSMGSGAYLATKSEREVYEAELERERREIEQSPDEERTEVELFYQLKGFSAEEAALLAKRLQQVPDQFLKTLAHEELGLAESTFPNPTRSAISATLSTALGAFIPIIPFFFTTGTPAIIASAIISLVAHFAVGAAKVLVTTRPWWATGLEMTIVGTVEAAITYGLGLLFGPVLQ